MEVYFISNFIGGLRNDVAVRMFKPMTVLHTKPNCSNCCYRPSRPIAIDLGLTPSNPNPLAILAPKHNLTYPCKYTQINPFYLQNLSLIIQSPVTLLRTHPSFNVNQPYLPFHLFLKILPMFDEILIAALDVGIIIFLGIDALPGGG